jgi:hypothetical protein
VSAHQSSGFVLHWLAIYRQKPIKQLSATNSVSILYSPITYAECTRTFGKLPKARQHQYKFARIDLLCRYLVMKLQGIRLFLRVMQGECDRPALLGVGDKYGDLVFEKESQLLLMSVEAQGKKY